MVNGGKSNDPLTTTQAEVTIVIKDVNDEPPAFNKNEYYVEISEDIPNGFALPNLNMTVTDPDVVSPKHKFNQIEKQCSRREITRFLRYH